MKATETAVDTALAVLKNLHGKSVVKFSVKLLPANMGFANCSGLKFSLDFQNTQKQSL